MKVVFRQWAADDVIEGYLDFVRKRKARRVWISYLSKLDGLRETLEGRVELGDRKLKEVAKKVQYGDGFHNLTLSQKDWKVMFQLSVRKDSEHDYRDRAELQFDDSLRREVVRQFKVFGPQ